MKVSTGRKIWECANPFVFLIVTMFIATLAVITGITVYSGAIGETTAQADARVIAATVWCDLAFYLTVIVVKYKTIPYETVKYGHGSKGWSVWKLAAAVTVLFLLALAVNVIIDASGLMRYFSDYTNAAVSSFAGQSPVVLVIVVGIIGPIAEEIIFRFMIFGRIRHYFGKWWGIIISALLFGAYHGTMVQFIFCTAIGILFAYAYDKCGKLWVPIAAHMAVNIFGLIPFFAM